jgi:hypothetical protein
MKQIALSYYQDIYLVLIAFFIFFGAFIYIFITTYSKSRIKHYKKLAQLPLEEEGDQ